MSEPQRDDWQEVWDARLAALSAILGPPYQSVYHARHPFAFGGQADGVAFPGFLNGGIAYVTWERSGKSGEFYADYELMICHRQQSDWGPGLISCLAPYTQQAYIAAGESMDIDEATPAGSRLEALLFDTYGCFELFGKTFELRLGVGITKAELAYKFEHGADAILALLKSRGIYPFTDLDRDDVELKR